MTPISQFGNWIIEEPERDISVKGYEVGIYYQRDTEDEKTSILRLFDDGRILLSSRANSSALIIRNEKNDIVLRVIYGKGGDIK